MGRKKYVWIALLIIAAIAAVAAEIWLSAARSNHASPGTAAVAGTSSSSTAFTTAAGPETSSSPSVGFIYENDRFIGGDPYNDAEFAVYDTHNGTSETLKAFNASFATSTQPWQWNTPEGTPIILSTLYDGTPSTSEVEFFDPQKDILNDVSITRSPIIDPNASVGISSASELIAYCDDEGQFTVLNAETGSSSVFDSLPTPACYTGEESNNPYFSRDGASLSYVTIPMTEQGPDTTTSPQIWKLDLANGTTARSSWLTVPPMRSRVSPDGTEYAYLQYGGFTVRQLIGSAGNPVYDNPGSLGSLKILGDATFSATDTVGGAVFSNDGKGVFYYTSSYAVNAGGGTSPSGYALGYYDIAEERNYYPLPAPQQPIAILTLLGALDKDHLVYEATAVPFSGTSQAGHIITRTGSSSLYLQGVDAPPTLVATSTAGFSLKSFLISK